MTGTDRAIDDILEERARALAASPAEETSGETVTLVVLALGGQRYGVEIERVKEIEPLSRTTLVPGAPDLWAGILNLRGELYPVLETSRYLGLAVEDAPDPVVVLVARGDDTVALRADDVPEILEVPTSAITPPLPATADGARRVHRGVTPDMVSILDVDALLTDPDLAVRHEAT